MFRAFTLIAQQRWAAALEAIANAERPYRPIRGWPLLARAQIRILTGQPAEALPLIEQALATDLEESHDIADALFFRCQANLALGRYDDAVAACESAVGRYVWWRQQHLYLVAAYALTGDDAKAAAEKGRLLSRRRGVSIADIKSRHWSDAGGTGTDKLGGALAYGRADIEEEIRTVSTAEACKACTWGTLISFDGASFGAPIDPQAATAADSARARRLPRERPIAQAVVLDGNFF